MYKTIILQQKANVLTLRLDKQCNRKKRVPSAGKRVKDTTDPIVRNPTKNKLTATPYTQKTGTDPCRPHTCHFSLCDPILSLLS